MTTLIFLATILTLLILLVRLLIKLARRKPVTTTLKTIGIILLTYSLCWLVFDVTQKQVPVPIGTDVCFDDWCATVTSYSLAHEADSTIVTLNMRMSNRARGIAQSPSEPRVHINGWPISSSHMLAYEKIHGFQPNLSHRLELHQSMNTVMVFALPNSTGHLKALIEEGPWITRLLLPDNQLVFNLK